MGEHRSYAEASRSDWGTCTAYQLTIEQITLGATLRIADAAEAMAKSHTALIEEKERYKRWYEEKSAAYARLDRSYRAIRGHLTRIKRQRDMVMNGLPLKIIIPKK